MYDLIKQGVNYLGWLRYRKWLPWLIEVQRAVYLGWLDTESGLPWLAEVQTTKSGLPRLVEAQAWFTLVGRDLGSDSH